MKRLIWSGPARRDLFHIAEQAGEIDADLPLVVLERITKAPLSLLEYPGIGTPIGRSRLCKGPVRKTPFILIYTERGETMEVHRVLHTASDWLISLA